MTPEERIERVEEKLDRVLSVLEGVVAFLERWAAVLPEPGTLKAKLGKRKLTRATVDLLDLDG